MDHTLVWHCPGCKGGHGVPVLGGRAWGWNQSVERPTLTPSVHVLPHEGGQVRCHCFVRDGRIEFLSDCGHALAGRTVDMEEE